MSEQPPTPEAALSLPAADVAGVRAHARRHDWSEAEVWQLVLALGLERLEQEQHLAAAAQSPDTDWATLTDDANRRLLDDQTAHGRLLHRCLELEHDLRIMDMRRYALEIELPGMRAAVERCRQRLRTVPPPPPAREGSFGSRLRRTLRTLLGG